ncbi:DUF6779 domain-containing protein [Mycobacterium sp. IDR2000157661]|uniref:DUF6779 domain-containing protein n=1 Tax=Mycobacterium sp. IDR2000157661 TaxID=2867005 RepID=UPI001EEDBC83|nr:DUF6779 domain-containing protein [Mycobacterium sp. IDR2000157661]ULE35087.1 hypothetical protein K3G64_11265 [Mycobacterium sp. IDR2000157661]
MTEPTRSARPRRGGRRPGWVLLTALLVLAIAASSALVFTNRVELLKLAVILALWAAVVAAFVSVIYRRQSDVDQAKVRDLKLVYDLQLDREISARREYELSLEAQLRRELASEIRAQAADEVAGLRAELAALRANLEMLFDADLGHRPAIENERRTVRAYSDWARDPETTGRVSSTRIDAEYRGDADVRTEESPIIDVPAEPHRPEYEWTPPPPPPPPAEPHGGAHRRPSDVERETRRHDADEPSPWSPPPVQPPPPQQQPLPPPPPRPEPAPEPAPVAQGDWQPAPAEGQWIPAGTPGSNWTAPAGNGSADEYVGRRRAPEADARPPEAPPTAAAPPPEPRRGRHSAAADTADGADARPGTPPTPAAEPTRPSPRPEGQPTETEGRRHRSADDTDTAGQSVADLLARLQATPSPGGRRRRREE